MEGARRIDAELIRTGHHIEVACLDPPSCAVHPYPAKVHLLGRNRKGYKFSWNLVRWLFANRHRFDAVIVDGLWQFHAFAVWLTFRQTQTPYFVFTHGMLDPWFKRAYPLKHLKKLLYWLCAECHVVREARAVLFTCEEERLLARKSFPRYRVNEVVTCFGTADAPGDADRLSSTFFASFPQLRGKRILLFLGRIDKKKGCDTLIKAFAAVANGIEDLHLVIAGPDQTGWSDWLKASAQRLNVSERITWAGMVSGDIKWGAYYAADAFCLPSHQENFGIVVAESLACGTPVLISDKVNIWREIVADGAGVVREDTLKGTIQCLAAWEGMALEEKMAMRRAARRCFDDRFRVERAAENLVEIISTNV